MNHLNSFCRGMFKVNAKFDADSLLYSLSHFDCDGHTVHMLIQWQLPPPLTSIVKSSLFMHAHFSSLSLAARLHRCCTNHPHCINNDWTFSRQTSYADIHPIVTGLKGFICLHTSKPNKTQTRTRSKENRVY